MEHDQNENQIQIFDNNELSTIENEVSQPDKNSELLLEMLEKAIKLPGVKVNRTAFLMDQYGANAYQVNDPNYFSELGLEKMDRNVSTIITKNVTASSSAAFALGLPGALGMVASIPADIMQNFAFSLRLAQQIAYSYGFEDIFEDGELTEKSRTTLLLFLGIMFMATGSGALLRAITPNVGRYAAKQIISKPLTKTIWYPALKKITAIVSQKTITKTSLAGITTKAIPIVGGVASAGINMATMIPMANRLKEELRKYHLSESELMLVVESDKKSFGDKASDLFSDVLAGGAKSVENTKKLGSKFSSFLKDVESKTKSKINKE